MTDSTNTIRVVIPLTIRKRNGRPKILPPDEVMVRVRDSHSTKELADIFDSALDPRTRCWILQSDASWVASPAAGEEVRDHQRQMMRRNRRRPDRTS